MTTIPKTKSSMHKTYQLLKTIYPDNKTEEFIYDNAGNREKRILTTNDTNDYLHNANNEMHSAGDTSFNYDVNGSMIEKVEGENTWGYIYNVENRLSEVKLNGNLVASYYYDPFGRRLWKEVGGVKTYFFYSNDGLSAELNNTGEIIKTYGYRPNSVWSTNPLFTQENGEYYFFQNDHLTTPQKLIASNGAIVWKAQYESFGKSTIGSSIVKNNLRFPGQYFDEETGDFYNLNRTYMPGIGRYSQNDSIGLRGGINLFNYVKGNPIISKDPLGLDIYLQWHEVGLNKYHTLIRIVPCDQENWKNRAGFKNIDKKGKHYITFGAGPENGLLKSNYNRSSDIGPHHPGIRIYKSNNCCDEENLIIDKIFELYSNYKENLDYDLLPATDNNRSYLIADDGYNSNSYISGLISASGLNKPTPPVNTPGWDKPVPEEENFKP